jgi:hypothetical protein
VPVGDHAMMLPMVDLAGHGVPFPRYLGVPGEAKRLGSIHPTAWNRYSRKFALGGSTK